MDMIEEYREMAADMRAKAALSTMQSDRRVKLEAARKLETMATEVEVVVGPSGECWIEDWLD